MSILGDDWHLSVQAGWFFANSRAPTAHYFKRAQPQSICGLAYRNDAYPSPGQSPQRCRHCAKALERIARNLRRKAKVDTDATTEEDAQQGRMRATVTVASRERFATVANRERAHQLADDLLGGRVTLHGPVPIETVVCLAQAVADYRADAEPVLVEGRTRQKCDGDHPTPECDDPQCWHRDAVVPIAATFSWGSERMYFDDEQGEALCRVTPSLLQRVFDWARERGIIR